MAEPKVEGGLVVGNTYDKYGSSNPVARLLLRRFLQSFDDLVRRANPTRVLEVGCGEGELALRLAREGRDVLGTDISSLMVSEARTRARSRGLAVEFKQADLFSIDAPPGSFDLVVCCEVLEHLEEPEAAVAHLTRLSRGYLLFSVPREPLWRILNMARGEYLGELGNTPGHIQHWSWRSFRKLLSRDLDLVDGRRPLPWLMALCRPQKAATMTKAGG